MRIKARHVIKFSIRFNKITLTAQGATIQQLSNIHLPYKLLTNH